MKSIAAALILASTPLVYGCVRATDLSVIDLGATRAQIEAELGNPIEVLSVGDKHEITYEIFTVGARRCYPMGLGFYSCYNPEFEHSLTLTYDCSNKVVSVGSFNSVRKHKRLCLAAHNGDARAQVRFGTIYELGSGAVSPDPVLAYVWYSLATANGYRWQMTQYRKTDAGWECCFAEVTQREILADSLNQEQLAEAARLIAEWEPNPEECEVYAEYADN